VVHAARRAVLRPVRSPLAGHHRDPADRERNPVLARINVDITETELIIGMVTMAGGWPSHDADHDEWHLVGPQHTHRLRQRVNTGVQRVSAALGLAVLTAW